MSENIEYEKIVYFIENDILNTRLINNSMIEDNEEIVDGNENEENDDMGGGTLTYFKENVVKGWKWGKEKFDEGSRNVSEKGIEFAKKYFSDAFKANDEKFEILPKTEEDDEVVESNSIWQIIMTILTHYILKPVSSGFDFIIENIIFNVKLWMWIDYLFSGTLSNSCLEAFKDIIGNDRYKNIKQSLDDMQKENNNTYFYMYLNKFVESCKKLRQMTGGMQTEDGDQVNTIVSGQSVSKNLSLDQNDRTVVAEQGSKKVERVGVGEVEGLEGETEQRSNKVEGEVEGEVDPKVREQLDVIIQTIENIIVVLGQKNLKFKEKVITNIQFKNILIEVINKIIDEKNIKISQYVINNEENEENIDIFGTKLDDILKNLLKCNIDNEKTTDKTNLGGGMITANLSTTDDRRSFFYSIIEYFKGKFASLFKGMQNFYNFIATSFDTINNFVNINGIFGKMITTIVIVALLYGVINIMISSINSIANNEDFIGNVRTFGVIILLSLVLIFIGRKISTYFSSNLNKIEDNITKTSREYYDYAKKCLELKNTPIQAGGMGFFNWTNNVASNIAGPSWLNEENFSIYLIKKIIDENYTEFNLILNSSSSASGTSSGSTYTFNNNNDPILINRIIEELKKKLEQPNINLYGYSSPVPNTNKTKEIINKIIQKLGESTNYKMFNEMIIKGHSEITKMNEAQKTSTKIGIESATNTTSIIGFVPGIVTTILNVTYISSMFGIIKNFIEPFIGSTGASIIAGILTFLLIGTGAYLLYSMTQLIVNRMFGYSKDTDDDEMEKLEDQLEDQIEEAMEDAFKKSKEELIKNSEKMRNTYKMLFSFNIETGCITFNGNNNKFKNIITSICDSDIYGISHIYMITDGTDNSIKYDINATLMSGDSISYIEGHPVHLALVMAYLFANKVMGNKHLENNKYLYSLDENNMIKVMSVENNDNNNTRTITNPNIYEAIYNTSDDLSDNKILIKTCQEIFNIDNPKDPVCSMHFYSILGKSAISMITNIGTQINSKAEIFNTILKANPGILYEILKNLNWKLKINKNQKKEMVNVNTWLSRLKENERNSYSFYLDQNPQVKNLLEKIVERINNDPGILEVKYEETVQSTVQQPRKKKRIMNSFKNAMQHTMENSQLYLPQTPLGFNGFNFYQTINPFTLNGGSKKINNLEEKYNMMTNQLAKINQKISTVTNNKILHKIESINKLSSELDTIINKINEYTNVIKNNKVSVLEGRTISMEDIEDLIVQYTRENETMLKKVISVSTAFGKIKMMIEEANLNPPVTNQETYFNM